MPLQEWSKVRPNIRPGDKITDAVPIVSVMMMINGDGEDHDGMIYQDQDDDQDGTNMSEILS